jgi:3',5'-cyclic AMP phosphodiesterase CpdA
MTVMQISDLHFGDVRGGNITTANDPKTPPFLSRFPFMEGLLGHPYRALSALDSFRHSIPGDVLLVVTGDITAHGASSQLSVADQFLSAARQATGLGLGHQNWREFGIPGNHDQWSGRGGIGGIFGRPLPPIAQFFPGAFPVLRDVPLGNDIFLRLLLIDTDADVPPYGLDRMLARGKFVTQLAQLSNILHPREPGEIRILVLHHSLTPGDPSAITTSPHMLAALEIDRGTRQVLDQFLVDYDVKVVLSGHRHIARLSRVNATNGNEVSTVLESRCGTTTQMDRYPPAVLAKMNPPRKLPPNTLIMHYVVEQEDGIYWQSRIYWRSAQNRFVHQSNFVTPLPRLSAGIKVL